MLALSASPQHPAEADCMHRGGHNELPKEACSFEAQMQE